MYVVGSIAYDEIMDFPGQFVDYIHPDKIHQLSVSFGIEKLTKQLGGVATNMAYGLRLVGDMRVLLISGVGQDARDFIEFFKKNNIGTDLLQRDDALYCATGKVITDRHNNQIWGFYYGACELGKNISFESIDPKTSLVILSSTHAEAFTHAQSECVKRHIPYVYDPGMVMTFMDPEVLRKGIEHAHMVIANDYEMAHITKATKSSVEQMLARDTIVVTTLGEKGVRYQTKKETIELGVVPNLTVVDPTGAGDNFRGGFLGSLGKGSSVKDALAVGSALASFAIETYGTTNHAPTRSEIEKRAHLVVKS